jgi:hypothetical protein
MTMKKRILIPMMSSKRRILSVGCMHSVWSCRYHP